MPQVRPRIHAIVAVVVLAVVAAAGWWWQRMPAVTPGAGAGTAAGSAGGASTAAAGAASGAPRGGAGTGSGPGAAGGPGRGGPPAVEVAIVQAVPLVQEAQAVGTLLARQRVAIRPEVAGRIVAIGFVDGAPVRKGQVLF